MGESAKTEVEFRVIVTEDGGIYGATLYVDDGRDDDEGEVPCWRTVFRGKPSADPEAVGEMYADCHQDAMDEVGVSDPMTPEEWLEKMRESVILAGELMERFGYRMVPADEVSEAQALKLFDGMEEWIEKSDAPADVRKLN